ncbi:glycosyltransferase family 2 protein [Ramlibacter solisilvae]|uniref:Glycosyl transferase n=1 Tax=Ramlibacter tataouinensis TaxID=94132 RepID=A0A127JQ18_9BURK|nr:glycosyltransferase [Ramlibacter tataouinensis]AMO22091.1 glycosyl transferase [Ramlibacter tataouinensis]
MKDELVSIITPAYKAAGVIGRTVDSVLAQTYPHWEMLIADDCSPDDTRAVVSEWARRDARIQLIPLERNGGPAAARNAALAKAQGRWVAFLDSDDMWLPNKLERSLAHAQAHRSPLVFTGFRRVSHDESRTGDYIGVPPTLSYGQLLGNTAIATSTVLVDRSICGDVRMQRVYYDDFVCWLGILKRGFVAHGLDEDLMRYRVMAQSVSRNKGRSAREVWKTYRQVEGLALPSAAWHFSRYAFNALRKYRKF